MMHTLEDDFTFKQKFSDGGPKECETFLAEKYAARQEKDPTYVAPKTLHPEGVREQRTFVSAKSSTMENTFSRFMSTELRCMLT